MMTHGTEPTVEEKTVARTDVTVETNLYDLCRLGFKGMSAKTGRGIPDDAEVLVSIPGGGDYSNMDLDPKDLTATVTWGWDS